tara:strand:+ start:645 stop:1046 length:402 start_codon:yes stop_codon:yes gene_type:complete
MLTIGLMKKYFNIFIILSSFILLLNTPITQALELDLTAAQDAVGRRFASKFCEAKEEGFSSETSSEFALNNTYLKFVAFPDDEKFIKDLWDFTLEGIRKSCGEYVTESDEDILREFFEEEGEIASNRDLYLPH